MPFKSKAQWKRFFAMARRGEISKEKAKEWARETKTPFERLPEKKKKTAACLKMAADLGKLSAIMDAGFEKNSAGFKEMAKRVLIPGGIGALIGSAATIAATRTKPVSDQIRGSLSTTPQMTLIDLLTAGMPPSLASHILTSPTESPMGL